MTQCAVRGRTAGTTSAALLPTAARGGCHDARVSLPSADMEQVRVEAGLHLHWQGRRSYRSRVPAPRVLEVDNDLSYGNSDIGNLVIEGDNLQVMVSLKSQYEDSFDVVFIDPPYNRGGNDFRYSDARFKDPDADAGSAVYVSNEDGERHTKWLNFMAPRLVAMKDLMADHGIIFVTISDIELGRLLMLMDEVFDERNRIAVIAWKGSSDNNPTRVAIEHEYILVYAKNVKRVPRVWSTPDDEVRDAMLMQYEAICAETADPRERQARWAALMRANKQALARLGRYTNIDAERGPFQTAYRVHNPKPGGYRYGVTRHGVVDANSPQSWAMPLNGYRFPPSTMERHIADGIIVFPKNRSQIVQMKDFLVDYRAGLRSVIELDARKGSYRLKTLFGKDFDGFRFSKPIELVEMLVGAAGGKNALVLDAFAGSGSTGDAVMQLNARDGGKRRFVLIEEGSEDDQYARSLLAPRLKRAIELDELESGFSLNAGYWMRNPSRGDGYGVTMPMKVGDSSTFYPDFLWWVNDECYAIDPTGAHILDGKVRGKLLNIDMPKIVLVTKGRVTQDWLTKEDSDGYTVVRPRKNLSAKPEYFLNLADALKRIGGL